MSANIRIYYYFINLAFNILIIVMPIIQKITKIDCEIAILNMKKSLGKIIEASSKIDLSKFKNKKKKNEIIASRILLNELLPNSTISYNIYGAPEITTNKFISISHSQDMAAIIISKKKAGLDIEKISAKPIKLASKFIDEKKHAPLSEEKATLIWSCKEAIYKWHQKGNINFISDIKISKFNVKNEGKLIAKFKHQKLTLHYQKINDYFLVYVCK